jgi:hypothetical protein
MGNELSSKVETLPDTEIAYLDKQFGEVVRRGGIDWQVHMTALTDISPLMAQTEQAVAKYRYTVPARQETVRSLLETARYCVMCGIVLYVLVELIRRLDGAGNNLGILLLAIVGAVAVLNVGPAASAIIKAIKDGIVKRSG